MSLISKSARVLANHNVSTPVINRPVDGSLQIWYAKNIKGGADTVTANFDATANDTKLWIVEISGADLTSPLDVTATGVASSGTSITSGNFTTNYANELILAIGLSDSSNVSVGPGYTAIDLVAGDASANEYRVTTSVGTYNAVMNFSSFTKVVIDVAAFKAAAPGIQVSVRSDTLSDSRPSATSNHTIIFTTNNAIYGSSVSNSSTVTLTLDSSFSIPAGMDCGDVDAATSSQFNFNYPGCGATATAWGFSATGSVITLVPPSDSRRTLARPVTAKDLVTSSARAATAEAAKSAAQAIPSRIPAERACQNALRNMAYCYKIRQSG
jgi:hypothetical protein